MSQGPWSIEEARAAANMASAQQKGSEQVLREATQKLADAERAYRMALAQSITRHRAEGHAATVCADLARGDRAVAQLRWDRDVAQGVVDAAQQASWRHAADRRDVARFADWSMRRELSEHGQPDERLSWTRGIAA